MTYREYIQSSFWLIFLIFGSIFTILSFGFGLIITIPMYFASKNDYKNNYLPTMDIYSRNDVNEIFYEINTKFRPKIYVDVFGS